MNVRKPIDYSELFAAVDRAVSAALPQMELYREIGRLVCDRPEKGAAVAVAEHLQSAYPDMTGFSPRNVRRMRDFYRKYENAPGVMREAMRLGWTQNLILMDADLILEECSWYIRAALRFGWSKKELADKISEQAIENISLDIAQNVCYDAATSAGTDDGHAAAVSRTKDSETKSAQHIACMHCSLLSVGALRADNHSEEGDWYEQHLMRLLHQDKPHQENHGNHRGRAWRGYGFHHRRRRPYRYAGLFQRGDDLHEKTASRYSVCQNTEAYPRI